MFSVQNNTEKVTGCQKKQLRKENKRSIKYTDGNQRMPMKDKLQKTTVDEKVKIGGLLVFK